MPTEMPYQVLADTEPGRCSPTEDVRYTEKTKVTITVLKPDDPQSHSPQATTCRRVAGPPGPPVRAGVLMAAE
ncbi:hypothetical protein GCM10011594_06720 [Nakamurella endophytica]|uniref:Uncharacterized protein n=1 Tax=Nakamurella endophytica TaxID=1748367 RepID=A0A917SNJ2_9ACTN|nr:hypothetical protein GCM10011594_06720 [Nakamurella endophytica]